LVEENLEVLGIGAVGLGQQCDRLLVSVALGVLTEPGAADDLGGGDAGMDAERHVGVSDVVVLDRRGDRFGRQIENWSALAIRPARVASVQRFGLPTTPCLSPKLAQAGKWAMRIVRVDGVGAQHQEVDVALGVRLPPGGRTEERGELRRHIPAAA
jgi:hypothetical protein